MLLIEVLNVCTSTNISAWTTQNQPVLKSLLCVPCHNQPTGTQISIQLPATLNAL